MAPKQRISLGTAIAMVIVALLLDGLQGLLFFLNVIPVIGTGIDVFVSWFISILAATIFGLWFAVLRVSYFEGKGAVTRMLTAFGSLAIELLPFIDTLPAITLGVLGLIIQTRRQDAQAGDPSSGRAE